MTKKNAAKEEETIPTKEEIRFIIEDIASYVASFPFIAMLSFAVRRIAEPENNYYAKTDGRRIYYGKKFFTLTRAEQVGVDIHELFHILFGHIPRLGTRNPKKWNFATDYAINLLVKDIAGAWTAVALPSNCLYDPKYKDKTAEVIYDLLDEDHPENDYSDDLSPGYGGCGDGDGEGQDVSKEILEASVRMSLDGIRQGIQVGNLPFGGSREIGELERPKLDWRRVLEKFIQEFLYDYSFQRRDRRYGDVDYFIPTLAGKQVEVSICIDASGSISKQDLATFGSELFGVISALEKVKLNILTFDTGVYNQEVINTKGDLLTYLESVKGGGGTDFRPAMEEADKHGSVILFFTDGYGPFPDFPPRKPVLWLCHVDNDKFPDYGTVCYLRDAKTE